MLWHVGAGHHGKAFLLLRWLFKFCCRRATAFLFRLSARTGLLSNVFRVVAHSRGTRRPGVWSAVSGGLRVARPPLSPFCLSDGAASVPAGTKKQKSHTCPLRSGHLYNKLKINRNQIVLGFMQHQKKKHFPFRILLFWSFYFTKQNKQAKEQRQQ